MENYLIMYSCLFGGAIGYISSYIIYKNKHSRKKEILLLYTILGVLICGYSTKILLYYYNI